MKTDIVQVRKAISNWNNDNPKILDVIARDITSGSPTKIGTARQIDFCNKCVLHTINNGNEEDIVEGNALVEMTILAEWADVDFQVAYQTIWSIPINGYCYGLHPKDKHPICLIPEEELTLKFYDDHTEERRILVGIN